MEQACAPGVPATENPGLVLGTVIGVLARKGIDKITLVASPGVHDTLHAACDVDRYRLLGHQGYHANCADNLRAALGELGLGTTYIPAPFNMFERVVVTGGQNPGGYLEIQPPLAMPGDYLLLRAELDHVIVVLSACPQDMSLTNGLDRTPKDVEFQIVDRA